MDGESKANFSVHWNRKVAMCAYESTERSIVYLLGREGCWKQFNTKYNLISTPQWHHTPHSGLLWIYKVTNMMPVAIIVSGYY